MGRHAAPSSRLALSRSGRHAGPRGTRVLPVSAGVALAATAGVVVTVGGPSGGVQAAAVAAPAAAPVPTAAPVDREAVAERAGRDRPAVTLTLPATAPPAPTTPPPPPAPVLPGCTDGAVARAGAVQEGGYANGRLPDDVLCPAVGSPDERLRADAAVALVPLAQAYRARFGTDLCVTDGYRPLAEQAVLRRTRPRYAAPVGTSNHGWGTAVDISCGVNSFGTERHAWMRENAPRYGWVLPEWAQPGGSRPEPWHWEYVPR